METFECGIHDLEYRAVRAGCPACTVEREVATLRRAVQETSNQLEMITNENRTLKSWQDLAFAIREAAPLLDDNDLAFLKATLYEWRDSKSLALKVTHGPQKKKRQPVASNGFIVMPRKGDPYGHLCTSMGGLAIADYYDEAANSFGSIQAMQLLVRGMAPHLPGGK